MSVNQWFDSDESDDSDEWEDLDPMGIMFSSNSSSSDEEPKPKRANVRSYYLDRDTSGAFEMCFQQLARQDPNLFYDYTRMSLSEFEELLLMVGPMIQKETVIKVPMTPALRLAITLRYYMKT